jgi:hypothetical protein
MTLDEQLRAHTRSYVSGKTSLADLRTWIEDHAEELGDLEHAEAQALEGLIWLFISELDLGHRSEPEIRAGLMAELGHQRPTSTQGDAASRVQVPR